MDEELEKKYGIFVERGLTGVGNVQGGSQMVKVSVQLFRSPELARDHINGNDNLGIQGYFILPLYEHPKTSSE